MTTKIGLRTPSALVVSVAWLSLALWWTFIRPFGGWGIPTMDPNAWGDWAGGTFAPLAFLWLVVGYFQQGEELRLQAAALNLQVQELKESVEQQTALAKASVTQAQLLERGHLIALRAQLLPHQPRFSRFYASEFAGNKGWGLALSNLGSPISNARVTVLADQQSEPLSTTDLSFWYHDDEHVALLATNRTELPVARTIRIDYIDELLCRQFQIFHAKLTIELDNSVQAEVRQSMMTFNLPDSQDWNALI